MKSCAYTKNLWYQYLEWSMGRPSTGWRWCLLFLFYSAQLSALLKRLTNIQKAAFAISHWWQERWSDLAEYGFKPTARHAVLFSQPFRRRKHYDDWHCYWRFQCCARNLSFGLLFEEIQKSGLCNFGDLGWSINVCCHDRHNFMKRFWLRPFVPHLVTLWSHRELN